MTQKERDNLLLDLKKGQEERDKVLLDLKKGQEELVEKYGQLSKGYVQLSKGQKETNCELRKLSQTVAKIEQEHGQKLQILLDVVTSHIKKFDSVEEKIDKHDKRLDKHDDEIYCLNSKVQAF